MKLSKLYIKDFFCYDDAYIDFSEFSTALIVGKTENNSDISNGVGKTTIFRAIEYVLFGHADINLEHIIRDDMDRCNITFDFFAGGQEYRVSRTRTRKGVSDLTLYKRTGFESTSEETFHNIKNDQYIPAFDVKFWADISGRRASDTEKELAKLIGVNLKSFRIFVHFLQRDFGGLAVATPEKRKQILKDALSLAVYSKLEKIAKDKYSGLNKEADRLKVLIDNLGEPERLSSELENKLLATEQQLEDLAKKLIASEEKSTITNDKIQLLANEHSNLENKFASLLVKQQSLATEKARAETSVKEYTTKKSNVLGLAKELITELKSLEELQTNLSKLNFDNVVILSEQIVSNKEKIAQLNLTIQNDLIRIEKLNKPLPIGGECEQCRQAISEEHRDICQKSILSELQEKKNDVAKYKKDITILSGKNVKHQQDIIDLTQSKNKLDIVSNQAVSKKAEITDKRGLYDEYSGLLEKFKLELENKKQEIEQVNIDLQSSSLEEAKLIQDKIKVEKNNLLSIQGQTATINKDINHFNNQKAVMKHDLKQKIEDKKKKETFAKLLSDINTKLVIYPSVIQGFSSSGIPNLIIQNVLDDLQIEANNLLAQLKPGLQLSFSIEKTNSDGVETDTLEINYSVNGKKRYYENISGAMQLAVNFSLKLGLSFFLQKMSGADVKFLLLDEIDQSLDKASVDFFADIVKFFQKDYTILVITHNDNLKHKFQNMILVNQDSNLISKARVVSTW